MVNYTPKFQEKSNPYDIPIKQVIGRGYTSFDKDDKIFSAIKILVKKQLSGAPVTDNKNKILGFLSEKDCLQISHQIKYYNDHSGIVADYMTVNVICLESSDSIFKAIELFIQKGFHSLPIVEDGKLIGILDRHTVLKSVSKMSATSW
jgi:predicted transcriptional regulator